MRKFRCSNSLKNSIMKTKIFFISFVCCFALQANAQTSDNTIVNNNSSWATLIYGLGAYNIPCCVETQYVCFDGDSTIAAISYKKVFSYNDKLHENIKYEGLIREQEQKTYFIPAKSEVEYLLYDFSLEDGMNFEYKSWEFGGQEPAIFYVSTVDSFEVNGSIKKRIQIKLSSDAERIEDTWIEEIGSLSGILYPCYRSFVAGSVRELLCYYQDDELFYKNPAYPECYYDNPDDITSVQTIVIDDYNIYPNPVNDALTVFSSHNPILRIEIFDASGKKVYSQAYKDAINVSSFSKGLYLLKVYDINAKVSVFKIIKK